MAKANDQYARSVATGIGGTTILFATQMVLQLGLTAVLSRLLLPREFGVVAAAMVFITFARLFSEIGISQAIVQLPNLDDRMLRVAQGVTLLASLIFFGATQLLAPIAASWFRQPELENVIRVLAGMFVIQSQSLVPMNYLFRQLAAPKVTLTVLYATAIGNGLVAVPLAALGFSYWALIIGALAQEVAFALLLVPIVKIPRIPAFSISQARILLNKSLGFAMGKFFAFFASNGDNMIVGRYMSVAALGVYSRAFYLANLPSNIYAIVIERVVFPAIARVQHDDSRVRAAYLKGILLTSLVGLPLETGAIMLAPQAVRLLLGPHWLGVIVPFQILSIGLYPRLGLRANGSLQRGTGSVRTLAVLQFLSASLVVLTTYFTYPYGLTVVAGGIASSVITTWIVSTTYCCWATGVSFGAYLRQHVHGAAASLLLAAVLAGVLAASSFFGWNYLLTLLAAAIGVAILVIPLIVLLPDVFIGAHGLQFLKHLAEPLWDRLKARFRRKAPALEPGSLVQPRDEAR